MTGDEGVSKAAKGVTSTVGNTVWIPLAQIIYWHWFTDFQVGGLTNTVGGIVGAAARGLGETVSGATGSAGKPVGDGVANVGDGVEDGSNRIAQGAKNAGEWKT